jgi:deazaflavin-dependent oxidoreductase (nitroreductase family)
MKWQSALNAVMRALLGSPLHFVLSGRLLIIEVTGRRSGTLYRLPVGYVEHDGEILIGTGGRWHRNLVAGESVTVVLHGKRRPAHAEVVTDEHQCAELYRHILAGNPVHGKFVGIALQADGSPDPADLRRALASGVAVVRLAITTCGASRPPRV